MTAAFHHEKKNSASWQRGVAGVELLAAKCIGLGDRSCVSCSGCSSRSVVFACVHISW